MRRQCGEIFFLAEARLPKMGRSVAFGEVVLTADGPAKPIAQASSTYALAG